MLQLTRLNLSLVHRNDKPFHEMGLIEKFADQKRF